MATTMSPVFDYFQTYPKVSLLVSGFVAIYVLQAIRRRAARQNLPPGPKGVPFFGNLFQMSTKAWYKFEAWGKEFGDLTSI
jgi:hypothetical protein